MSNPVLTYFHFEMLKKETCHTASTNMLVEGGIGKWLEETPTTH